MLSQVNVRESSLVRSAYKITDVLFRPTNTPMINLRVLNTTSASIAYSLGDPRPFFYLYSTSICLSLSRQICIYFSRPRVLDYSRFSRPLDLSRGKTDYSRRSIFSFSLFLCLPFGLSGIKRRSRMCPRSANSIVPVRPVPLSSELSPTRAAGEKIVLHVYRHLSANTAI